MVSYWLKNESVEAKVFITKEGHYAMRMQGEKYDFPGHPRGVLLYGDLSPLKHKIKNAIFNDTWAMLEEKKSDQEIMERLKNSVLPYILGLSEDMKYDMLPYERMVPSVKEIYRAMTVVYVKTGSENVRKLRDLITFVLQEDDAYRFRFQWVCKFLKHTKSIKWWEYGLRFLEHAETIGDMKERQRLFRRIVMFILKDEKIKKYFEMLMDEINFKKVQLSKADKYFFRAKYFKVDYPEDNSY